MRTANKKKQKIFDAHNSARSEQICMGWNTLWAIWDINLKKSYSVLVNASGDVLVQVIRNVEKNTKQTCWDMVLLVCVRLYYRVYELAG